MKRTLLILGWLFVLSGMAVAQEKEHKAYVNGARLSTWLAQYTSEKYTEEVRKDSYYTVGKGWGYVVGVLDADTDDLVIPKGVKLRDVMYIVARFLQTHPDLSAEPASELIVRALKEESARREAGKAERP